MLPPSARPTKATFSWPSLAVPTRAAPMSASGPVAKTRMPQLHPSPAHCHRPHRRPHAAPLLESRAQPCAGQERRDHALLQDRAVHSRVGGTPDALQRRRPHLASAPTAAFRASGCHQEQTPWPWAYDDSPIQRRARLAAPFRNIHQPWPPLASCRGAARHHHPGHPACHPHSVPRHPLGPHAHPQRLPGSKPSAPTKAATGAPCALPTYPATTPASMP